MRDNNPVLFCVHKHLYGSKGRKLVRSSVSRGHVPDGEYLIALGEGDIKNPGRDVTVVASSLMLHRALNVAEALENDGISVEVIDPRCLVPFDTELGYRVGQKNLKARYRRGGQRTGRLGRTVGRRYCRRGNRLSRCADPARGHTECANSILARAGEFRHSR